MAMDCSLPVAQVPLSTSRPVPALPSDSECVRVNVKFGLRRAQVMVLEIQLAAEEGCSLMPSP